MANIGPSKIPGKKAGPNGSFPVGDPVHAKLAIPMAARSEHVGNITPAQEHHIQAEARAELNKSGNRYPGLVKGDKRASRV